MAHRRSPHAHVGRHRSTARPARVAAGLLISATALLGLTGAPATARPAQDPGFTTATVDTTTTIAPGASTTVAGTEPTGTTSTSESTPGTSSRILTESRKIMAIVGGLIVIALALTLLTIRYWRQTKPVPLPASEPVARHAKPELTRAQRRAEAAEAGRRRSRRSVAGADHAAADEDWEPRGTGEHERVVIEPTPTSTGRHARPSRVGREAALRRTTPPS